MFSKKDWNFGYSHRAVNTSSQNIPLNGTPIFFTEAEANPASSFVDLALSQTLSQTTASNGNTLILTLRLENKGTANATSITVKNVLPEGFSYVSATGGNFSNGVWTIDKLASGGVVTLPIQVKVNTITAQVSNIAQIQNLEEKDDNFSNNTTAIGISPATNPVKTKIDLEMSMSVDRTSLVVGEPITYTITVLNQEEVEAKNIVVDVPLKNTNFTLLNQFSTKGSYDHSAATWKIPNLGFREAVTLKVKMQITSATPFRHFIQIQSASPDDIDSTPGNYEQIDEDDQFVLSMPNDGNPCFDDALPPKFVTCPQNITVKTATTGAYVYWLLPNVTDRCGNPILTANYTSGQLFPIGNYTVNYKATDNKNLVSTCNFTISVVSSIVNPCDLDSIAPVISNCPRDITLTTTTTNAIATWAAPTITDNCSSPALTASHISGSNFNIGTTTVTYTAKDARNNQSACSFKVIVNKITAVSDIDESEKLHVSPNPFGEMLQVKISIADTQLTSTKCSGELSDCTEARCI